MYAFDPLLIEIYTLFIEISFLDKQCINITKYHYFKLFSKYLVQFQEFVEIIDIKCPLDVNSRLQTRDHRPIKCSKLKLFLEFPTISIIYLIKKINITQYRHFKENLQNVPNNVINDLYKLCFQNLLCIFNISSYKKEQLKLHRSFLSVTGVGGQPSE